jgi:hypothetical protein
VEELQGHADEPVEPVPGAAPGDAGGRGAELELPEPTRRRRPSTVGGAIYLAVLAGAGVGLGIVSRGNWRLGVKWIAASLVVAAVVRLALPPQEAGMLAVRRRFIDVALLALVGVGLWFLSTSIPNQPLP